MTDAREVLDLYRTQFQRLDEELSTGRSWTRGVRKRALACFFDRGFPTPRDEEWKYTNVAPIAGVPFEIAGYDRDGLTRQGVYRLGLSESARYRLVFLNGYFSVELSSSLKDLPARVMAGSLAAAMKERPGQVEPYWARYASYADHAFVALNTALNRDGAFLHIPRGVVLEEPIHLLFLSTAATPAPSSFPRNLIVAEADSQCAVVESYASHKNGVHFTNAVTEIVMGPNAVLTHTQLQRESARAFHVGTLQTHQESGSSFRSHSLALGGALARNDLNVMLNGEGAQCDLNGLYVVGGEQHVDNHTRVDHVKPHCISRELYKGVLSGHSRGVFNGKVYVHGEARGTDARQTNKNLLLSNDASIDTKPQLEIYNNDVKCTHGSSIGQLDPNELFYLRSRGLDRDAARALLTRAFISEVASRIAVEEMRTWLEEMFLARFQ